MPLASALVRLLPLLTALLPLSRPLSGGAAIDAASLVALALVDRLPDPCPAGMVLVDGEYCPALSYDCLRSADELSAYRCAEYMRRAACPARTEPRRYCIDRYEWPNLVGENPRVFVTFYEAKSLCATVGKRLCARSEWMLACEGPKRLPYPYGYVRQPSPCNIDRSSVPFDVEAMLDPATREDEITRLWQADPIGAHPACVSAWGAYDMSGNVDEWTDNSLDAPNTKKISTLNGGYWGPVRDTCRLTTSSHGPKFAFYQVGFRCCADAVDGLPTPPIVPHDEPEEETP